MSRSVGKQTSKALVWVLMALLILGLGGFGISNFGGSVDSIGKVGDREIDVDAYARALRQEINAQQAATGAPVTLADAEASGLAAMVRMRLIGDTALDAEMARLGVSVSDEKVLAELTSIAAFQGTDGSFDREQYRFLLRQSGLTEARFEADIRDGVARGLLQQAVIGGVARPETFADALVVFLAERRSASLIRLDEGDLETPVPAPSEAQIEAQYAANPDAYTAPATKQITYAWLTPDMMLDRIELDEEMLRSLYEERIDEFVQPERRLVERMVFASEDDAEAARAAIEAGETTFEEVVADRGLTLADVDLGDVSQVDIGGAAGQAVFALEEPGITGPHGSDLGPALFRVNAILVAQETSFEEAREALADEAARDRAVRLIAERITDLDDMLAAGATLEEIADETEMALGQIAYNAAARDDIAAYDGFRAAADAVQAGDFPEILELDDGGIFALRLDGEMAATLRPLDEVRAAVSADWRTAEIARRLTDRAEALRDRLEAGAALDALGPEITREEALPRGGLTPPELSAALFELPEPGATTIVAAEGTVWLVRLDEVLPPEEGVADVVFLRDALAVQAGQDIARELYENFARALVDAAGLSLDQAAINAVHAQFR